MANWMDDQLKDMLNEYKQKLAEAERLYGDKSSRIRDFNEFFGRYGITFSSILEGKVDLHTHDYGQAAKDALAYMWSNPDHQERGTYDDFMNQAAEARAKWEATPKKTVETPEEYRARRRAVKQRQIAEKNLRDIENMFKGLENPTVSQQIHTNRGYVLTPYHLSPVGVPTFDEHGRTQQLIGYFASGKSRPKEQHKFNLEIANDVANSTMLPGHNQEIRFQGGGIWAQLDSPAAVPAYSGFSVNAQHYIEQFEKFNSQLNKGRAFVTMDIETYGDMNVKDGWFHANEIAAQRFKFDKKTGQYIVDNRNSYSWLTKPTDELAVQMRKTIQALQTNPFAFQALPEWQKRSLVDLMQYSTSNIALNQGVNINPAQFIPGQNGMMNVIHSNAKDLNGLYSGKSLNERVIMEMFGSYSEHMLSGLQNQINNGTAIDEVMGEYNTLISRLNKTGTFVATHNGDAFDIRGLNVFGGTAPKNTVDWLRIEDSVFADKFVMHDLYDIANGGKGRKTPFVEGPGTLQEHRRTLNMILSGAHTATDDIGMDGLGGVILKTRGAIDAQIRAGQTTVDSTGLRERNPVLSYSRQNLKKNQTLFATNAVRNYSGNHLDFQAEWVDGKLEVVNPGFNKTVLNAESFYTALGVRKLNGENRFALELLNESDGTYSYIVREGEQARAQIAQFVQQHLTVADDMMELGKIGIVDMNATDIARRRYESLLGLNQGYTKGYEAAKRIFDNVRVFRENAVDPKTGLPLTQAQLEAKMNFNSLVDGQFNRSEADAFWRMFPRLDSEYDAYQKAFKAIDEALPDAEGLTDWQRRDLNMQRSLALRRFGGELDHLAGGAQIETRPALPYEGKILKFQDRLTDTVKTINLKDVTSANQDINNYIYDQHRELAATPHLQKQVAGERYISLITSLYESNYMDKKQFNSMVSDFYRSGDVSPSIFGKALAMDLSSNLEILESIENKTIEYRSLREAEHVKNLSVEAVERAATNAADFAVGVKGFRQKTGGTIQVTTPGEMEKLFQQLDQVHDLTKLTPNHREAIMGMIERFASRGTVSHGVGMAVTASMDNSLAYLNIFDEKMKHSVLSALEAGDHTPYGVLRVAIPLINQNGSMRYGEMHINANSTVIADGDGFRKVSSVERFADSFYDSKIYSILKNFQEGNLDKAQRIINNTAHDAISELAGTKRNIGGENDTMFFKGTEADLLKQSHVDVAPAMIHDYVKAGIFQHPDDVKKGQSKYLNKSAFDNSGNLKTYFDYDNDLTLQGKEYINANHYEWAKEHSAVLGGEADLSGIKEEHAWNRVAMINARNGSFMASTGPHTRPNTVQRANYAPMTENLQNRFLNEVTDGTHFNFDTLTTTPLAEEIKGKLPSGDKAYMNIKMAVLSEQELQSRIKAMQQTADGRKLLMSEGILDAHGNIDPTRLPTVWEQAAVMNKEVIDRLWMEKSAFYDVSIPKDKEVAAQLIDEATVKYKAGTVVKRGQVIGVDKFGDDIIFNAADEGVIAQTKGRLGIRYAEQAHKLVFDLEKTTPFSGGYSLEFLEALTGVKGIGGIIGPDIGKHGDIHHLYRGHMNRIAEAMNNMSDEEVNKMTNIIHENFRTDKGLGLQVIRDTEGKIAISDNLAAAGFHDAANIDRVENMNGIFANMMRQLGFKEYETIQTNQYGLEGRKTVSLLQSMSMADVQDYSRAVGEEGVGTGNVRYGTRELTMLKRVGLDDTHDAIKALIQQEAIDAKDWYRGVGTIQSLQAMAGKLEPEAGSRIWNIDDFRPLPEVDSNQALYRGTIFDTKMIQKANGYNMATSTEHGFWLKLPEMPNNLEFKIGDRTVDKIFIPYMDLEGKGNEVWKNKIQQINTSIVNAGRRIEEAKIPNANGLPNATELNSAFEELQEGLTRYGEQIREDVGSSKGFLGRHVFGAKLQNSASGIAKIMSPELAGGELDNMIYLNPKDAEAMGILEHLNSGKDFYAPVLRNPTFHTDAIQIAKVAVSENVKEGQQLVSSMLAAYERADMDGDSLRTVAIHNEAAQTEMAARHKVQNQEHLERLQRYEAAYERATTGALEELQQDHKGYLEGKATGGTGYLLSDMKIQHSTPAEEAAAKFGKHLVGMASNLNYRYMQLAQEHFNLNNADDRNAFEAMSEFFEGRNGIEQKIISAKHGGSAGQAIVHARHGGLQLIEALSRGQWDKAFDIDNTILAEDGVGSFTKKARMEEAIEALRMLQSRVGDEKFKSFTMGFGTGGGVYDSISNEQLIAAVMNEDPHSTNANMHLQQVQEMMGTAVNNDYVYDHSLDRPPGITPPPSGGGGSGPVRGPEPHIPSGSGPRPPHITPGGGGGYTPRGLGEIESVLESVKGSKIGVGLGIAAALGAGALFLTSMTGSDELKPEDQPHNDELIQGSHGGQYLQGHENLARVSMNGEGLDGGMRISVSGRAPGHLSNDHIGGLTNHALTNSGYANVNIRSQDDTSSVNREWLQQQFTQLINNGYVGPN